jgi:hypothetical protein
VGEEFAKTIQQELLGVFPVLHITAAKSHHGIGQAVEKDILRRGVAPGRLPAVRIYS